MFFIESYFNCMALVLAGRECWKWLVEVCWLTRFCTEYLLPKNNSFSLKDRYVLYIKKRNAVSPLMCPLLSQHLESPRVKFSAHFHGLSCSRFPKERKYLLFSAL